MKPVVMIDRGDHWDVIADYSASSRHSYLAPEQWQLEFLGPSYAAMRASQPGAVAAMVSHGCGKWKKDWSGPYAPPKSE